MIDLNHEYHKIRTALDSKVITEGHFEYELYKLRCTSSKYKLGWEPPVVNEIDGVQPNVIEEDFNELKGLYENGMLKKKFFLRDCAKLLALCETVGYKFPGNKLITESLNVHFAAGRLITEDFDDVDYDELDDEEDYGEEGENEQLQSTQAIGDMEVQLWIVDSEYEFRVGGETVNDEYITQYIAKNADSVEINGQSLMDTLNDSLERDLKQSESVAEGYAKRVNETTQRLQSAPPEEQERLQRELDWVKRSLQGTLERIKVTKAQQEMLAKEGPTERMIDQVLDIYDLFI